MKYIQVLLDGFSGYKWYRQVGIDERCQQGFVNSSVEAGVGGKEHLNETGRHRTALVYVLGFCNHSRTIAIDRGPMFISFFDDFESGVRFPLTETACVVVPQGV